MYELTVRKQFAAAHSLWGYQGKCSRLHGHTWTVEVSVAGVELDENGMLIDFQDIKKILENAVQNFDHQYLNDLEPFNRAGKETSPTAENIARYFYRSIKPFLKQDLFIKKVTVRESSDAWASYIEEV